VRAWMRRPDALRVEDLDGHLLKIEMGSAPRTVGLLTPDGGREVPLRPPSSVTPVLGADGVVRERPPGWDVDYDDPVIQDCAWVAMLDPVELADGDDGRPATTFGGLRTVEHHGLEAWGGDRACSLGVRAALLVVCAVAAGGERPVGSRRREDRRGNPRSRSRTRTSCGSIWARACACMPRSPGVTTPPGRKKLASNRSTSRCPTRCSPSLDRDAARAP
jgi:hypothetical protein